MCCDYVKKLIERTTSACVVLVRSVCYKQRWGKRLTCPIRAIYDYSAAIASAIAPSTPERVPSPGGTIS
jgi:hypothetical protein